MITGVPLYSGYTCPATSKCWFDPGSTAGITSNTAAFVTANAGAGTGAFNRPGDAPAGNIIGPGYYDWDISIRKRFNLPREGMGLVFQTDLFNAFNRANWGNPGTSANGGLGTITSSQPPRQMQFGLKFNF